MQISEKFQKILIWLVLLLRQIKVPQVMEDCIAKDVKAVIIYSSGFAEIGEEGKKLQEEAIESCGKRKYPCARTQFHWDCQPI